MKTFKNWMKLASGLEKKRLARLARVSFVTLYRILHKQHTPTVDVASAIESASEQMIVESDYRLPKIRREDLCKACRKCPYYLKSNTKV
jgi:transposase